jgi:hypothetical protein
LGERFVGPVFIHLRASGDHEAAERVSFDVHAAVERPCNGLCDRRLPCSLRSGDEERH